MQLLGKPRQCVLTVASGVRRLRWREVEEMAFTFHDPLNYRVKAFRWSSSTRTDVEVSSSNRLFRLICLSG